ncbi:MAG TPA: ABC transporter ATP-binding protein [Gammaproteobacteria bacterium]|nr:ABC transporter ATP-binding protein [Gammaproteobacteria bacterium]
MKNIYRNIRVLTARKKIKIVFIVFLFLMLSLVEVLGLGLIPTVFMKGVGGDSVALPIFGLTLSLTAMDLAVLVVMVYLVKAAVYSFSQYQINRFVFEVMHGNRMRMVDAVVNNTYVNIRKIAVADHINMIQLHVNSAANGYLIPIFQILSNLMIVLMLFILLSLVSLKITAMASIVIGLVSLVYYKKIKRRTYDLGKTISRSNRNIIDLVKSLNQGWRVIKSLGCESYIRSKIDVESVRLSQAKLQHSFIHFIPKPLFEMVLVAFVVLSFVYLLHSTSRIENIIGLMSLLGVSAIRLVQITATLMADISRVRGVQHHVDELVGELVALDELKVQRGRETFEATREKARELNISLENITFRYPEAENEILHELSLSAKSGDIIGLVGESGVGKSTLMNIMMGFFSANHGHILFCGREASSIDLIENSAYLTQDNVIFNDTLFNNLALSDVSITREYAQKSLEALSVLNEKLTLDTMLGESGVSLSGGEAQRVAIARTYAHRSKIIVLDEPTSSLDEENEKIVMEYIRKHRESRITFVVSHRDRLLDVCDVVYVLKGGRLGRALESFDSQPYFH